MSAIQFIDKDKLKFDPQNPRLVEFGVQSKATDDQLTRLLCESMAVDEIILSIVKSGYFENDPLIAIKEGSNYTVIEGNRRLAAIRVVTNHTKFKDCYPSYIPKPTKSRIEGLEKIPVFIATSRKDSWQYIGFKHVNGAAKWSSFAKAEYIAKVHNDFKIPLDEIALQIGDSNKTVEKLYQALMVIEQAEKSKVFKREEIFSQRLFFSHLYTGLQYEGIREFVGLRELSDTNKPIKPTHLDKLEEVLTWIFGNRKFNVKPVIVSQNPDLRNLDQVLRNNNSVQILRTTGDLNAALESGRPDENKFFEGLTNAKLELYKSLQFVATGYKGDEEQLQIAKDIANMSEELLDSMIRISDKRRAKKKK